LHTFAYVCNCRFNRRRSGGRVTAGSTWQAAAARLTAALHLNVAPIAITFSNLTTDAAPPFIDPSTPMPEPTSDRRTGRAPAGCVVGPRADSRVPAAPRGHGQLRGGQPAAGVDRPRQGRGPRGCRRARGGGRGPARDLPRHSHRGDSLEDDRLRTAR